MRYEIEKAVCFRRTKEKWGGFSNMCSGYPLLVGGVAFRTNTALYQALRFPLNPETQREVAEQRSPLACKMKARRYRHLGRSDWNKVRVPLMRWCLEVKLAQNWDKFSKLLLDSGDLPIVEFSKKDTFWGAKPVKESPGYLEGGNALGNILVDLRNAIQKGTLKEGNTVQPPKVGGMMVFGREIDSMFPQGGEDNKTALLDKKYAGLVRGKILKIKGKRKDPTCWLGDSYLRIPRLGLDAEVSFGANPHVKEGGALCIRIYNYYVDSNKQGKGHFSAFLAEVEKIANEHDALVCFYYPGPRLGAFLDRRGYETGPNGQGLYLRPDGDLKTLEQLRHEMPKA